MIFPRDPFWCSWKSRVKTLNLGWQGCERPRPHVEVNRLRRTWPSAPPTSDHRYVLKLAALTLAVFCCDHGRSADVNVDVVELPSLRIEGRLAQAHTQGLELVDGKYYVTARRDDVAPKQALLLRTGPTRTDWDVWDITPPRPACAEATLDHPGGMQSDGRRLWIPLAESKRNGRSLIRAFSLADLKAGSQLKPVVEFPVNDHIGALAVSIERGELFGANWDTEKVYVWDLKGNQRRILSGDELKARALGVVTGIEARTGVAVQDWKIVGDRLFASGLFRPPETATASAASRLSWFERFLERDFRRWTVTLPRQDGTELANEAMAVSKGFVYFLPEDLGTSNRLFRVSLDELTKHGAPDNSQSLRAR